MKCQHCLEMSTVVNLLGSQRSLDRDISPENVRDAIRTGEWDGYTKGIAMGAVQANLVVLPADDALEFLVFCQRNPKPCPVLDVTDIGSPVPGFSAPGADLRTDLPAYRVFRDGQFSEEVNDVSHLWRDDLVGILLGCSLSTEAALLDTGVPIRALEQGVGTCDFGTTIQCNPAGMFQGPMVVSLNPMSPAQAIRATQVSTRFPVAHGAPVHIGDPASIGIDDVNQPTFGDPIRFEDGDVPVFWACGITPQLVALESGVKFMITHKPGHMFITDLSDSEISIM